MDVLHWVFKKIEHNRGVAMAVVLIFAMCCYVGCEPTAISPISGKDVTAEQLEQEVRLANVGYTKRASELDAMDEQLVAEMQSTTEGAELARDIIVRKHERRATWINGLGEITIGLATGQITPINAAGAIAGLAMTALAGGSIYDNRRKDRKITELKTPTA